MHRQDVDLFRAPDFHPTEIDLATFDGWIQEIWEEDHQRLWERRKEKDKKRIILKQEADLRYR